ncbi:hypothetical protein PIB30_087437, partial [Stylosanthes scabra]|nr:hypothetical protein [Stylosanthes scabra]
MAKHDLSRSKGRSTSLTNSHVWPTFLDWTKCDPQPHLAQQANQGHVSVTVWLAQNVTPQQAPKLKPSLSK